MLTMLNTLGQVSCLINYVSSHCVISSDRLVKVWPGVDVGAYTWFTLTISPVLQPYAWPTYTLLWIAVDDNDDIGDGLLY
jgi:hypothetical protein